MIKPEYQLLIPCVDCGKKILRDHPQRLYCAKCKALKQKLKQKIKYQKKPWFKKKKFKGICVVCGSEFIGTWQKKNTCTTLCKNIHHRMVKRMKVEYNRIKINLFKSWIMWSLQEKEFQIKVKEKSNV